MNRTVFRSLLTLAILVTSTLSRPVQRVSAATFRNQVAQVPTAPTSAQTVRVWMQSDTAFGETAGLEYNIGQIVSGVSEYLEDLPSYYGAKTTQTYKRTVTVV